MLTRKKFIKMVMDSVDSQAVITSPGMISREVFQIKDRPLNFYMMGSMGCTIPFGIGVALSTKREVVVLAGDGDVLMDLGSLVLANKLNQENLSIYIIDNNSYSTTGGQKTCSDVVDFDALYPLSMRVKVKPGKGDAPRISLTPKDIKERFMNAIKEN